MFGILNLNKPAEWTSRDVVNRVQRLAYPSKAGHAGTLDPLATGVLVTCLGPAAKLIAYVQQMTKQYRACFRLGEHSASHDLETDVETLSNAPRPARAQIEAVLPRLVGNIKQTPPAYSAAKVGGRRAYRLARQDQAFEIAPRTVRIDSVELLCYSYPELELRIRCGSGTYIRTLGVDLAALLNTSAVMSALLREAVGKFRFEDALDIGQLSTDVIRRHLLPPTSAVAELRQLRLNTTEVEDLTHGRAIETPPTTCWSPSAGGGCSEIAALDASGRLVALLREKRPGVLSPYRVFPQSG